MAIFLDANIAMYAGGDEHHPLKLPCLEILQLAAQAPTAFLSSAEVLQEILHRYRALERWPSGRGLFSRFADLLSNRIEPVLEEDVRSAAALADTYQRLSSRDLVHVAVMRRAGATEIASADRAFDTVREIERLDPARLEDWRDRVSLR